MPEQVCQRRALNRRRITASEASCITSRPPGFVSIDDTPPERVVFFNSALKRHLRAGRTRTRCCGNSGRTASADADRARQHGLKYSRPSAWSGRWLGPRGGAAVDARCRVQQMLQRSDPVPARCRRCKSDLHAAMVSAARLCGTDYQVGRAIAGHNPWGCLGALPSAYDLFVRKWLLANRTSGAGKCCGRWRGHTRMRCAAATGPARPRWRRGWRCGFPAIPPVQAVHEAAPTPAACSRYLYPEGAEMSGPWIWVLARVKRHVPDDHITLKPTRNVSSQRGTSRAETPEALAGLHSDILLVVDEATACRTGVRGEQLRIDDQRSPSRC